MIMLENWLFVNFEVACARSAIQIRTVLTLALAGAFASGLALADDGAASIAAGGIVMVREPRVTMQKEVLRIGTDKVWVDYEFRNDTGEDITTDVAFPVPPYSLAWDERSIKSQGFDDFTLTIEGRKTGFSTEIKAKLKGRDVTTELHGYGIDIATFGHFDETSHWAKDIRRLSKAQRATLVKAGLLYDEDDQDEGMWSVEKKYYWKQTFPPHQIVHISHQYTPVLGNTNSVRYGLLQAKEDPDSARELDRLCLSQGLRKTLIEAVEKPASNVPYFWVDFILTTANTWKTPIEDFTLIVERPHMKGASQSFVSFCWDGPVTRIDRDHFSTHTNNLVPNKELRIGFIPVFQDF